MFGTILRVFERVVSAFLRRYGMENKIQTIFLPLSSLVVSEFDGLFTTIEQKKRG